MKNCSCSIEGKAGISLNLKRLCNIANVQSYIYNSCTTGINQDAFIWFYP